MNLVLYNTKSESNRVTKKLSKILDINGTLREQSSVLTPTITVESSNLSNVNYAYIPSFNRYYYVTDITSINNKLWQIKMRVDVLMTYKDDFLDLNAIVGRQENKKNLYLNDNKFKIQQRTSTLTKSFPRGFSTNGTLLLTVAGDGGGA